MTKQTRQVIPKRLRFEVLKLHKFTCQYCGNSAPDVLLHIDHIIPVAEGGTNDFTNLTVACVACNSGKGKIKLDDNTTISKSKKQMEELQERKEQLDLMLQWHRELNRLKENTITTLANYWHEKAPGYELNEHGIEILKKIYRTYDFSEILEAMDIACEQYLNFEGDGCCTSDSWNIAFNKLKGICRVRKETKGKPEKKELLYIKGIVRKRLKGMYYSEGATFSMLTQAFESGVPLEKLKEFSKTVNCWTHFREGIENLIIGRE